MLLAREEAHQIDHIDEAGLQFRNCAPATMRGGQHLQGRDIARAAENDIGLAAIFVAGPIPDRRSARAVLGGFVMMRYCRCGCLSMTTRLT